MVAHALSRATALTFVFTHAYARDNDESSKAKPVAKKISPDELSLGVFFGLLPLLAGSSARRCCWCCRCWRS